MIRKRRRKYDFVSFAEKSLPSGDRDDYEMGGELDLGHEPVTAGSEDLLRPKLNFQGKTRQQCAADRQKSHQRFLEKQRARKRAAVLEKLEEQRRKELRRELEQKIAADLEEINEFSSKYPQPILNTPIQDLIDSEILERDPFPRKRREGNMVRFPKKYHLEKQMELFPE